MLSDINNGVNKLVQLGINNNATVISFLNYDPDSEEVLKCKAVCQANSCKFEFYTNHDISELLKSNHQDLRKKYLDLSIEDDTTKIVVYDNAINSFRHVDVLVNDINWMNDEEQLNTAALFKEFVYNSFLHGNANYVELSVRNGRLTYIDDGDAFNFLDYKDTGRGGKYTLLEYTRTHVEFLITYRRTDQGINIYTIKNNKPGPFILEVKEDCSLNIDSWSRTDALKLQAINVPAHCNRITISVNPSFFMMSQIISLAKTIDQYLDMNVHVELIIPKHRARMFDRWIEDWSELRGNIIISQK